MTGKLFELETLFATGRYPSIPDHRDIQYLGLRQSIIECIHTHPGYSVEELSDPPSLWMSDVLYLVAEELDADMKDLQVIPALGTAADRYHGIDFFVLYTDKGTGDQVLVTVDLSCQITKALHGYKADLVVSDTAAFANPQFYPEAPNFLLPEIKGLDAKEEADRRELHRTRTAELIAVLIKVKIAEGDPHYASLYRHDVLRLSDDVRGELETVLHSLDKAA